MPISSKLAVAMASLTRWPTNDDDKEEDELNYVPLFHLSSFSLSSLPSLPRLLFSCPSLSALPATAAAVVLSIAGVAAGCSAGAVITIVTVRLSGRWGGGDGTAPGGRWH